MKWLKKVAATPLSTIAKVIDSLAITTNDRTNAPSIHAVNEALRNKWYPVGSVYMTIDNINPSEVFGGTWEQIKQRYIIAADDNNFIAGSTGGNFNINYTPQGTVEDHMLTINEIPNHKHDYIESTVSTTVKLSISDQGMPYMGTKTASTTYDGGGNPHNHEFNGEQVNFDITPPYYAVNVWVRIA